MLLAHYMLYFHVIYQPQIAYIIIIPIICRYQGYRGQRICLSHEYIVWIYISSTKNRLNQWLTPKNKLSHFSQHLSVNKANSGLPSVVLYIYWNINQSYFVCVSIQVIGSMTDYFKIRPMTATLHSFFYFGFVKEKSNFHNLLETLCPKLTFVLLLSEWQSVK